MVVVAPQRPSVNHPAYASPQDRDAVELVAACVEVFEGGFGVDFRAHNEKWYRQYRGFKRWSADRHGAAESDRDTFVADAKKEWGGANLHIPLSFRTIETMVPRAIAHAPRLQYMPREQRWEPNVDTVRLLIDAQQEQIDIDLGLQSVMRSGRIYGLGVGKTFWRREWTNRRVMKPSFRDPSKYAPTADQHLEFDDPDFVDVDVFDFMWDPMGSSMRGIDRAKWVVHRTWLDLGSCLERLRSGAWNTESAKGLLADPAAESKLRSLGSGQKYDEVWQTRMEASGFSTANFRERGEQIHEVWEWHDGERVLTVLDRSILVQDAESPCCGMLPFQVYRPTPLQKQMVGIGDLEPLEHLQREMDTTRSQITDAGTIALAPGFIYDDSMVDGDDLVFGPAVAIPVRNSGDIRNAIQSIQTRDLPGSAMERVRMIQADMELVSGLTDQLDPGQQGSQHTATGAQLTQALLGQRILLGSRRFELEVVKNVARCFLRLNQRMIQSQREIRQPAEGFDRAEAQATGRWRWFEVSPETLEGEFEIVPEGGSMAARNIPQDRQDAQSAMTLFGDNPHIDPKRPLMFALKKFGLDRSEAEAWLKQSSPPVPQAALKLLADAGVPDELIQHAVAQAQREDPQLAPDVAQADAQQGQAA